MKDDRAQEKSALFVATLTSFMGPFIISAVNVALPAIQSEFGVDAVKLGWVTTSLLLAVAVILVPIGKIADIHGRKKIFTWGLALYTIATLLAGVAWSVNALILFRVLQGFGAAMFITTGMAILTSVFAPSKRGRAIGMYVAAVYIGLSVGPFVGGILTQQLGWRSIFLVTVPLGAGSVYITVKYLKGEWADAREEKLDIPGSILYGAAILLLVYGATLAPDPKAVYLIAVGTVCLGAFIWQELKTRYPVFEVRLFTENKLFTFSSLAALINYSATFAVTFLLSLYLQYIKGIAPQGAGTVLVAQPIMMAIFSPLAGRMSDRFEPRKLATAGMALTALGLLFFATLGYETPIGYIVLNLTMLGFGFALFSSPNMHAIMGSVEKRHFGIASGAVATMRLLGQMTSMAIAMVILALYVGREEIAPANYDLFLQSVRVSFTIFALLCTIGIFFSFFRGTLRSEE